MNPAYQGVEIAGKRRRELGGGGGVRGKHHILSFPVGKLLFWEVSLAKILLLLKKGKSAECLAFSWVIFICTKLPRISPILIIREQVLTSPQPLAFDIPHTPLWSFLQLLLDQKECFLLCFLPLRLQVPNSLPGCSTYFSLERPSSQEKRSYKQTTTRKPNQTKNVFKTNNCKRESFYSHISSSRAQC